MIIGVVNEKGGTGKSTIAVNLAAFFLKDQGSRVLLVDADPQKSTLMWGDLRRENVKNEKGLVVVARTGKFVDREVKELSNGFDVVIIDTGGRDSVEMRKTMLVADVLVIPVVPSQFDAWGLEKTLSLFNEALDFNQKARALIVLNRVPFLIGWQKRELREMMEFLKEVVADYENVSVARNFLVERVEYKKSIAEGLSVHEVRGKAMEEFAKFFDEVRKSVA